jgi:hypothetical protein
MAAVLLLGIAMVVLTVVFWYMELKPFLEKRRKPKPAGNAISGAVSSVGTFFYNIGAFFKYGKYFIVDLFATAFLVSMLGFGDAVTGGVLGLTMSNAVSVLLLVIQKKGG